MHFFCALIFAILLWPLTLIVASNGSVSNEPTRFLIFSDLHLDPYYGHPPLGLSCSSTGVYAPLGQYGCDSPLALINATLRAAAAVVPDPKFILIIGDFVRHDAEFLPSSNESNGLVGLDGGGGVVDVIRNISSLLQEVFPNSSRLHHPGVPSSFANVLGNNDLPRDYFLNLSSGATSLLNGSNSNGNGGKALGFLPAVADVLKGEFTSEEYANFSKGGYYARVVMDGLTVLAINTVLYSPKHMPNTSAQTDPAGQFAWLRDQLAHIRSISGMAYIMGHIPPSHDTYYFRPMWLDAYMVTYIALVEEFRDVIAAQFFGHLHADELHMFPSVSNHSISGSKNSTLASANATSILSPAYIVSSISPVYGNNPSFRIGHLNLSTKRLIDFEVVYTYLGTSNISSSEQLDWKLLYSARTLFGLSDLTNDAFAEWVRRAMWNESMWQTLQLIHRAGYISSKPCDLLCRSKYICSFLNLRAVDFTNCVTSMISSNGNETNSSNDTAKVSTVVLVEIRWTPVVIVVSVVIILVIVMCVIGVFLLRRQKYQTLAERGGIPAPPA